MVKQGIIFAGVDADWFQVFMGVMLVSAVLVNGTFKKDILMDNIQIKLNNVYKNFGNVRALQDVSIETNQDQIIAF